MLQLIDDDGAGRLQRSIKGRLAPKHIGHVGIVGAAVDAGGEFAVRRGTRRLRRRRVAGDRCRCRFLCRLRPIDGAAGAERGDNDGEHKPNCAANSRRRRNRPAVGSDHAVLGPRHVGFDPFDGGVERCLFGGSLGRRQPADAAWPAPPPADRGAAIDTTPPVFIAGAWRGHSTQKRRIIINHRYGLATRRSYARIPAGARWSRLQSGAPPARPNNPRGRARCPAIDQPLICRPARASAISAAKASRAPLAVLK